MALSKKIASLYYILAPAYHGATTLSARANLHPDILSLGSGNPVRGEEQICSCGENVTTFCPFWTKVADVVKKADDDPLRTLLPDAPYISGNDKINKWLNGAIALAANEVSSKCWKMVYEPAERFFGIHDRYLSFIQDWAPHKVFLDGERSALKFMVMASMEFPVRGVVHLVRDPRGYAAAWKKYYPESTPEKLALEWTASHTRIRRLAQIFPKVRFLTLKYEDLIEQPVETLTKTVNFMNLDTMDPAAMVMTPQKNHLLGLGTLDHTSGMVPKADNWRETLHPEDQQRVVRAAGPLFGELGYKT